MIELSRITLPTACIVQGLYKGQELYQLATSGLDSGGCHTVLTTIEIGALTVIG